MEALGALSGGIAHDFNNILATMIGFTELTKDHLPQRSREIHHLERVLEAGLRGRELIKQLLTFSRKTEQNKKLLQLGGIVREAVELLRASIPTSISIRADLKNEMGVILADPVQMQQVLMNLCANAVCAMQEKGGVLDIGLNLLHRFTHEWSNRNETGSLHEALGPRHRQRHSPGNYGQGI